MPRKINMRPQAGSVDPAATEYHTRFEPGQRIVGYLPRGNGEGVGREWRRYTVARVGREWITLLEITAVESVQIRREVIETDRMVKIVDSDPATVLGILARNLEERMRLNLRTSTDDALRVLDVLEAML